MRGHIFGPEFKNIRAADPIQGQNELAAFAARFNESHQLLYVNETNCILETGADQWPFPVPIVRKGGVWFFDTAAGEDELLNRRIGRNELDALKAIRAAAEAQREFAAADHDNDGVRKFAQKFISSPGKKDGLYWSPDIDGEISRWDLRSWRPKTKVIFKIPVAKRRNLSADIISRCSHARASTLPSGRTTTSSMAT